MRFRRLAVLLLVVPAVLTGAASRTAPIAPAEHLPEPPIPPEEPPPDSDAPVPDKDLYAPRAPPQEGATLEPTLDARPRPLPGADPVPGTLYRSDQEQRRQFIPNPGIRLVVPIQK